jgi:transposase-like protein
MNMLPKCKCGYTRNDFAKEPSVRKEEDWGFWGWFWLLTGVSILPKKVKFYCTQCGKTFDSSTDPKVLRKSL